MESLRACLWNESMQQQQALTVTDQEQTNTNTWHNHEGERHTATAFLEDRIRLKRRQCKRLHH
jgi:hypothetical protein